MRIDKKLNLIIPIDRSDGTRVYVHSEPISAEVFDTYYRPLSRTFTMIYAGGLGEVGGPRVADKLLRDVAKEMKVWDTDDGVQKGLMREIYRLSNLVVPMDNGWEVVPYHEAKAKKLFDAEDFQEVEAAIVFFTVASCMHRRRDLPAILNGAMKLWGALTTYSHYSEFITSLRTSIEIESTGETAEA